MKVYFAVSRADKQSLAVRTGPSQGLVPRFEASQSTRVSKHARCCKSGKTTHPNTTFTASDYLSALPTIFYDC